jgi:hypothetical protein
MSDPTQMESASGFFARPFKIVAWILIAIAGCSIAMFVASLIRANRDFRAMVGGSRSVSLLSVDFEGQQRRAGFSDGETAEFLSRIARSASPFTTNESRSLSYKIHVRLSTGSTIEGVAWVYSDCRTLMLGVPESDFIGEYDHWFVDLDTNAPPKLLDLLRFLAK